MSKTPKSIVFFGNEKLATGIEGSCLILERLLDAGYKIAALVINQQNADEKTAALPSVQLAGKYSIPIYSPDSLAHIVPELRKLGAAAGVVAAYGRIIPVELLDLFPSGLLNIHPSLLPKYRGPTPIESAILNGDSETGVSLIKLSPEMDAGPIYAQANVSLDDSISKQSLADKLTKLGAEILIHNLPDILNGNLKPESQNDTQATYCSKIQKADGQINWHQTAVSIERQLRAYAGWPGSRTQIWDKDVIITKARLTNADSHPAIGEIVVNSTEIVIGAQDGSIAIDALKPAGKTEMTSAEFIRGYQR